jgi:hypothetical protein
MTDERFENLMAELIAGLEARGPSQPPRAAGAARTIFLADTTFVSHRRHSIKEEDRQ